MAVQRLYQVGDAFSTAPSGQGDDALPVADGDTRFDGSHFTAWHGVWIDLHKQSSLGRSTKCILLGRLLNNLLLPVVICFERNPLFCTPAFHTDPATATFCNPCRPFLQPFCMIESCTLTPIFCPSMS